MEVHHHPHLEKKGFKEYFWEFIMIFLAVTLGFFAENIREKISDKAIENEYMQSLVSAAMVRVSRTTFTEPVRETRTAAEKVLIGMSLLKINPWAHLH